jgi:hypothetical protein
MPRNTTTRTGKPGSRAPAGKAQPPAAARRAAKAPAAGPTPAEPRAAPAADAELYRKMVATAAYYIAEQRGFAPGHELADWVAAEAAVAAALRQAPGPAAGAARTKKRASRSPP